MVALEYLKLASFSHTDTAITYAITYNNKIKTLTKRSYGFHDQNFFLLKLLSLHHAKYKLLG